ncbi:uncharacterized protein RBU33_018651 isoform 4-T6 [Hipposideros larvatus]
MRSCTCSVARTQTAYIGTDRLVAAGPPYLAPEQGPEYGGNSEEHRVVKGPARRGAYQWMRGLDLVLVWGKGCLCFFLGTQDEGEKDMLTTGRRHSNVDSTSFGPAW